jgi:hypothetical protein
LNQNLQKDNLNDIHYNLESKHYFSVRIECVRTLAVLCRNIDEMTNWRIHSIHQYCIDTTNDRNPNNAG